jgi:hypothetical protein
VTPSFLCLLTLACLCQEVRLVVPVTSISNRVSVVAAVLLLLLGYRTSRGYAIQCTAVECTIQRGGRITLASRRLSIGISPPFIMSRRLDPHKNFTEINPEEKRTDEIGNIYPRLVWNRLKHLGYPIRDGFPSILELQSGSRLLEEIKLGDICRLGLDGRIDRLGHYLYQESALAIDPTLKIPTLAKKYPNFDTIAQLTAGEECLDRGCYRFTNETKWNMSSGVDV